MAVDIIVGFMVCSVLSVLSLVICAYETIIHKGEYWLVYAMLIFSILLWLLFLL